MRKNSLPGALLLGAGLIAFVGAVPTPPSTQAPPDYATSCALTEPGTVQGYVTNRGGRSYLVSGQVVFSFYKSGSISRPQIAAWSNVTIASGQTARAASAPLAFDLMPGEECRFEVRDALRTL